MGNFNNREHLSPEALDRGQAEREAEQRAAERDRKERNETGTVSDEEEREIAQRMGLKLPPR